MDSEEKNVAMESLGRLPLRRIVPQTTDAPTDASTGAYQSSRGHHGRKGGKYQAEITKARDSARFTHVLGRPRDIPALKMQALLEQWKL